MLSQAGRQESGHRSRSRGAAGGRACRLPEALSEDVCSRDLAILNFYHGPAAALVLVSGPLQF